VKFAIDSGTEIGQRAARILLGDHDCTGLVILNKGWLPDDPRVTRGSGTSSDVIGVDAVISDGTSALTSLIGKASVAGIPLVVWPDAPESDLGPASIPVIVGANVGSALVDALLTHPASSPTAEESVTVGWTEPGKPQRNGAPIAFPEPVGMAWSDERQDGRFVGYRDDEWAGATTIVEGPSGQRIVGVADLGAHLEALTLVAVSLAAARGSFETGIQRAGHASAVILKEARGLELDVAVWRSIA
jgi:hypothetical protein